MAVNIFFFYKYSIFLQEDRYPPCHKRPPHQEYDGRPLVDITSISLADKELRSKHYKKAQQLGSQRHIQGELKVRRFSMDDVLVIKSVVHFESYTRHKALHAGRT